MSYTSTTPPFLIASTYAKVLNIAAAAWSIRADLTSKRCALCRFLRSIISYEVQRRISITCTPEPNDNTRTAWGTSPSSCLEHMNPILALELSYSTLRKAHVRDKHAVEYGCPSRPVLRYMRRKEANVIALPVLVSTRRALF